MHLLKKRDENMANDKEFEIDLEEGYFIAPFIYTKHDII